MFRFTNLLWFRNVITKTSPMLGQIFYSIFLRPKKDGSYSFLIVNLKTFNEAVSHYHFKMVALSTITKLVTKNCFMAAIDLMPIIHSHQIFRSQFLRLFGMAPYMIFTCLPNGLSCAPMIFTKILKSPLSSLHTQDHIAVALLDDLYVSEMFRHHCVA